MAVKLRNYQVNPTYSTTRDGFGRGIVEISKENSAVIGMSADLTESTRMHWFKEAYPSRFFEMGVAEENMIGVAAGLAMGGKIPVAASYSVFSPGNSLGPLRSSVCYPNLPVKILGGHAGLSAGPDGVTHQALEDLAIMRTLPNMTVVVPCDEEEARKATIALISQPGPGYLRVGKHEALNITNKDTPFTIGKAEVFRDGSDLSLVAAGTMVAHALDAAAILSSQGISARVINLHTIKPIDKAVLTQAAAETGAIVTCEEHQVYGGLGSAVAEVVVELPTPVPMGFVGMPDGFAESAHSRDLMKYYGLFPQDIVAKSHQILEKKGNN